MVANAQSFVHRVQCSDESGSESFLGTGFDISNGVVTASHVISGCSAGPLNDLVYEQVKADVLTDDPTHDLALLASARMSPTAVVGGQAVQPLTLETAPAHVGEPVVLLGIPGSPPNEDSETATISSGNIIATNGTATLTKHDNLTGETSAETLNDAIAIDAPASAGESGGPAIDAAGKVVGVIEGGNSSVTYLTPASDVAAELIGTSTAPTTPGTTPVPTTTSTTPSPATPGFNAPSRNCDPNVRATPTASCPLAENAFIAVWRSYKSTGTIPSNIAVLDPTMGHTYELTCGIGAGVPDVVCNNVSDETAAVEFPLWAIEVYQGP